MRSSHWFGLRPYRLFFPYCSRVQARTRHFPHTISPRPLLRGFLNLNLTGMGPGPVNSFAVSVPNELPYFQEKGLS